MSQIDGPDIPVYGATAIPVSRRLKLTGEIHTDGTPKVALAGAGENWDGVSQIETTEAGFLTMSLKNKPGTFELTAADAFDAGATLFGAADGKVSDTVVGDPQFTAKEAAAVANERVEAIPNFGVIQTAIIPIEDLAAGADIADRPIFMAGRAVTLVDAIFVTEGAPADVDDANTCVVLLEDEADNAIVTKTYNTATQPPTSGQESLGTLSATHKVLAAGESVKLSITNGATADLPAGAIILLYR